MNTVTRIYSAFSSDYLITVFLGCWVVKLDMYVHSRKGSWAMTISFRYGGSHQSNSSWKNISTRTFCPTLSNADRFTKLNDNVLKCIIIARHLTCRETASPKSRHTEQLIVALSIDGAILGIIDKVRDPNINSFILSNCWRNVWDVSGRQIDGAKLDTAFFVKKPTGSLTV